MKVSELHLWSLETGLQAKQITDSDRNLGTARRDPPVLQPSSFPACAEPCLGAAWPAQTSC